MNEVFKHSQYWRSNANDFLKRNTRLKQQSEKLETKVKEQEQTIAALEKADKMRVRLLRDMRAQSKSLKITSKQNIFAGMSINVHSVFSSVNPYI